MKYLVLSDIHGSYKYASLAVAKMKEFNCEKILLLGDILYHGPRNDLPEEYAPKKVITLLNPLKDDIISIQGNCDAEVDQMVLDFPIQKEVDLSLGDVIIHCVHGHHLENAKADGYVLFGHTHKNIFDGRFLNIGSVSIPKDGYHTYAILEGNTLTSYNLLNDEVILTKELN